MKLNMVYLTNTYDSQFTLIDEESYNWVKTGFLNDMKKMKAKVTEEFDHLSLTIGLLPGVTREEALQEALGDFEENNKDENDRATVVPGEIVNGVLLNFQDIKQMMEAVRKNDIEIVEVYEGFIY